MSACVLASRLFAVLRLAQRATVRRTGGGWLPFAIFLLLGPPVAAQNRLTNGTFDTNISGWSTLTPQVLALSWSASRRPGQPGLRIPPRGDQGYVNPQGTAFQPIQDTGAFATCP